MTHEQLTVSVAIASWKNTVERADKVFSALPEEQFLQEVAPGRNRVIYLLGHLTTVHDGLHTILGLGERLSMLLSRTNHPSCHLGQIILAPT